jgi:Family of unknown function (DUF6510)
VDALDGNSIGGQLFAYFGRDMTAATGSCRHCGAAWQIGELMVYSRAPGAVARCPSCSGVVIVVVEIHAGPEVHLDGFALDESEMV